jgi:hypothetical protein
MRKADVGIVRREARGPRRFLVISGITCAAAAIIGAVLLAEGTRKYGVLLVVCGVGGFLIAATQMAVVRRMSGRGRPKRESDVGSMVPPAERANSPKLPADNVLNHWTGGISVPAATGRVSATFRVGILELADSGLTFRMRSPIMRVLFGAEEITARQGDNTKIFPVRRLVGGGIGIRPQGGQTWYFWTNSASEILAAIRAAGFEISEQATSEL